MHESVLKDEVIQYLNPRPRHVVLDATVGSAGHAEALLERIVPEGFLIGLDQDPEALERAQSKLARFKKNFLLIEANFRILDQVLSENSILKVDSILFDLGVSSDQLSSPERGFSFRFDSPLDMRMSLKSQVTAADLISTLSERELADIFWKFGEEHKSRQYAKRIVEERRKKPVRTTLDLAQIIEKAAGGFHQRIHPATKIFQALRIVVNDELGAVEEAIPKAIKALKSGGRLAVITFHSLEDRMVKNLFKQKEAEGEIKILTRKVVAPSREECLKNPRARSAKLRVAEKAA